MGREGYVPLFETKEAKGRIAYKIYAISVFVGVCTIWVYRATHVPKEGLRWAWFCMFGAEIWFGIYWIFTQSAHWRPVYRSTFKERLSHRYEDELPGVDIFVCTADPTIEPPTLVINTVLSVMAYDYPPEKLSIYLSDDGGSDLTFYALLEASHFVKHWIPFCRKFKVDPTSPAVYFGTTSEPHDTEHANQWLSTKGYAQREGIDFKEIFAPIVKQVSIRFVLALVAQYDLEVEQMDVKTAILHEELEERIYMKQPKGYEIKRADKKVYRLMRSLYGLKQSLGSGIRNLILSC